MKRLNGVVFQNGQTVSLDSTKRDLILNEGIKIPHDELGEFIAALRKVSRKALNGKITRMATGPKAPVIPGPSKLAWIPGSKPQFGEKTLIQRVAVAAKRMLGKRMMSRRTLEDALVKQLKEPRKRIMPTISTLIHKVKVLEVK